MWKSLVLAAVVCMAACVSSTEPAPNPLGVFALVSIGGHSLPVMTTVSDSARVVNGTITVRPDGRFVVTETDSVWVATVVPHYYAKVASADSGAWVLAGTALNFAFANARAYAILTGDELTYQSSGQGAWVYRRQ